MTTSHYRQLDESKIVATLTALHERIEAQFPDSRLGRVADELIAVAGEVAECADYLNAPNWPIRIVAGLLITAMIVVLYLASPPLNLPTGAHKFSDVQSIAAVLNTVAVVSVAVLFLLRLETNLKRRRAARSSARIAKSRARDRHASVGKGSRRPASPRARDNREPERGDEPSVARPLP
jgi:siroheme synthase